MRSSASSSSPTGTAGDRRLAGVFVGAGVGDDEGVGRGEHRVEQQLPVLAAGVALAGQRPPGQHVVAVGDADAGEDPVVDAEQADDPVGHGPHRHQRRDREHAGAEVGAGGPAGEPVGEHHAHVGEPEVHVGPGGRSAARRARAAPARAARSRTAGPPSTHRLRPRWPAASGRASGCRRAGR